MNEISSAGLHAVDRQHRLHTLLLHIAISCPANAAELSARIARPQQSVHDDLTTLMRDGVVHVHDGLLRTEAANRVITEADPSEVREVHDQVLAELMQSASPRTATLVALAESGCAEEALLDLLVRAVGDAPEDTSAMSAVSMVARTIGEGPEALRIRRAVDAARRYRPHEVISLTEALLGAERSELQEQAALLAAGAHLQSNRFERAAALYRHIGAERIGVNGAWAVVTAIGMADREGALAWSAAMPDDSLTSYSAGLSDLTNGLLLSLEGSGEAALDALARSASALAPLGNNQLLPESPASLAALVAFGRGEPATAAILLDRALRSGLGGESGRRRHLLLLSWGNVLQGQLEAAEQHLGELGEPRDLSHRDLLLYWCIRGGIGRRRADLPAMQDAWREINAHIFGMHLTLFDLVALGEMMVLAARLRDSQRLSHLVNAATRLLRELNEPPVWAAPFYWQGVQAAFQSEDPARLLPYANALAAVGASSPYAAMLASAGRTWLEVLRGEADETSVTRSVRALAAGGHTWDASRLAGQAALQHPERDSALSLMQLAREVMRDQGTHGRHPKPSILTAREVEVARLVLDGHGYRAVGEQLFISPKTVEHHIARIRNRIGASSRAELLEKLHGMLSEH